MSLLATGMALAAAFFPLMFNRWRPRDDEGVFIFGLREFLSNHGHLYSTIWSDLYGPFYYLFMSTVYRVIHQQPTLENGRWIVLTLTTASAALFGGAVWRATKNLPCTLLAEVAAFLLLIQVAGNEPMHPGSLEVFLVAVVAFELSSYAAVRRNAHLVGIGVATGALLMTKVNAGGLVAVAVGFAFVVGNRRTPRWLQIGVAVLTALVPIALMSQLLSKTWVATLAIVVVMSVVGMFALMSIDQLELSRLPLVPIVSGAAAIIVCSLIFPLVTGTPVSDEINGVFIHPLTFSDQFRVPAFLDVQWFAVALTLAGIYAAYAFRSRSKESVRNLSGWTHAALVALSLWLLGLGITTFSGAEWLTARWLPALVLLPAAAFCAGSPDSVRLALRSTVLLATLQVLVVYPVAGSQVGWGTVAMVVPCTIALAAGVDRSQLWRGSGRLVRGAATAVLCMTLVIVTGVWPPNIWDTYTHNTSVGLPGAGLMRIDKNDADKIQAVTRQIRANCDTFYGVPNQNSLYIFTGLPAVTGMVANGGPAGLTAEQQRQVVQALQAKAATDQRVCVVRSGQLKVRRRGPLAHVLKQYTSVVAKVKNYTIARQN